jgi:hypothetical protein
MTRRAMPCSLGSLRLGTTGAFQEKPRLRSRVLAELSARLITTQPYTQATSAMERPGFPPVASQGLLGFPMAELDFLRLRHMPCWPVEQRRREPFSKYPDSDLPGRFSLAAEPERYLDGQPFLATWPGLGGPLRFAFLAHPPRRLAQRPLDQRQLPPPAVVLLSVTLPTVQTGA